MPGLHSGVPALFAAAHRRGVSTSLNPQFDASQQWGGVRELGPLLDLLVCNETEARRMGGRDDRWASAKEEAVGLCLPPLL